MDRSPIEVETVSRMAAQWLGAEVGDDFDTEVAALLNALAADMNALREFELDAEEEPAHVYQAVAE